MVRVEVTVSGVHRTFEMTKLQADDLCRVVQFHRQHGKPAAARSGRELQHAGLLAKDERYRLNHYRPTHAGTAVVLELEARARDAIGFELVPSPNPRRIVHVGAGLPKLRTREAVK